VCVKYQHNFLGKLSVLCSYMQGGVEDYTED